MNKKNFEKKAAALSEIIILVASILTFAYFVGDEFRFVSAADAIPAPTGVDTVSSSGAAGGAVTSAGLPTAGTSTTATGSLSSAGPGAVQSYGELPMAEGVPSSSPLPTSIPSSPAYAGGTQVEGAGYVAPDIVTPTAPGASFVGWDQFGANIFSGSSLAFIASSAAIATGLYFGTTYLLQWAGVSPQISNSIGLGLSIGYGVGAGLAWLYSAATGTSIWSLVTLGPLTISGVGLIGAGIGALAVLIFYKDTRIDTVTFQCSQWQPVTGGNDCEQCNKGLLPCTRYKCESLGQSCKLLNEGTSQEMCTWKDRNDVTPPTISAWDVPLDKTKFEYLPDSATLPGDKGVIIKYKNSNDGCIPAFTRLSYGVTLDKPGNCRVDTTRTKDFASMKMAISEGNFLYTHSLLSVHGGLSESAKEAIILPNNGNFNIYIRCNSANGAANVGTFVFKYCVQKEPDITPPKIEITEPSNGWFIETGKTSQEVNIYTDKPADCKWSHNDEVYNNMPNTMTCSQSITEMSANTYYKCSGTLDGLKDGVKNDFYFNCKSYPKNAEANRYLMTTNYKYTLYGTQPLVLDSVTPDVGSVIKDATQTVKVTLTAKTSAGYNKGQAYCDFKATSQPDTSYVLFADTNSYQHSQDLWLDAGNYDYTIKCCDLSELGGNCAVKSTQFSVETDFQPPVVVRVYNDNNKLTIATDEKAECVYGTNSCSYEFTDGIKMTSSNGVSHTADWNTNNNYYIKCKDQFGNKPNPDECSITVRPFSGY